MGDNPIELPEIAATFIIRLHKDGNMSLEFSGPLASAPVAEHMLKKALQGIDDEKFAAFLKVQEEMGALVKTAPAAALNGKLGDVNLGRRLSG